MTFSFSLKPRTEKFGKSSFEPKLIFLGILKLEVSKIYNSESMRLTMNVSQQV
jgi:hypothetical protein